MYFGGCLCGGVGAGGCGLREFSSAERAPTSGSKLWVIATAGIATTGAAFVEALRSQGGWKSVDVYTANCPASLDFARAADGVIHAANMVDDTAAECPNINKALFSCLAVSSRAKRTTERVVVGAPDAV